MSDIFKDHPHPKAPLLSMPSTTAFMSYEELRECHDAYLKTTPPHSDEGLARYADGFLAGRRGVKALT